MNRISGNPPLSPLPLQAEGDLTKRQITARTRDDVDPQIRKAAEGMEAMFLDFMMKSMRQTVPKSDLSMENQATEIYRGMLDSEIAENTARSRTNGVGLADQIIAYLEARSYNQGSGKANDGRLQSYPSSTVSTGGTAHAGQSKRESEHSVDSDRSSEEIR